MTKIIEIGCNMGGEPPEKPEFIWRDELTPHVPIGVFPLSARPADCNAICRTMTQDEKEELLESFPESNGPEDMEMLNDTEMIIGTEHIETGAVRWNATCQCDLPPGTRIYTRNYGGVLSRIPR